MTANSSSNVTVSSQSGAEIEVPSEFLCPITHQIMVHPMTTRRGHNFERSAILSWLSQSDKCPLTRNPMKPSDLITNRCLQSVIKGWRIQHQIPEPTPEELQECEYGIVTFLNVSSEKHNEIVSRSTERQLSLLAAAAEAHAARSRPGGSSERRPRPNRNPALPRSSTADEAPVARRPGEGRRRFVSRILAAACRELEDA